MKKPLKFMLKSTKSLEKLGDDFVLVAVPKEVANHVQVLRDAVIDYAGAEKRDFDALVSIAAWLEDFEELTMEAIE